MNRWLLSVLVVVVALGGACRCKKTDDAVQPATPPGPGSIDAAAASGPDAAFDATMADVLILYTELATASQLFEISCVRMAAELERVIAAHQPTLTTTKSYRDDPAMKAKAEAFQRTHYTRITDAQMKLVNAASKCTSEPAVAIALEKLGG